MDDLNTHGRIQQIRERRLEWEGHLFLEVDQNTQKVLLSITFEIECCLANLILLLS